MAHLNIDLENGLKRVTGANSDIFSSKQIIYGLSCKALTGFNNAVVHFKALLSLVFLMHNV